jgi:type IV secretory pathway TrbF-like protein
MKKTSKIKDFLNKVKSFTSNSIQKTKTKLNTAKEQRTKEKEALANIDKMVAEQAKDDDKLLGHVAFDTKQAFKKKKVEKKDKNILVISSALILSLLFNIMQYNSTTFIPLMVKINGNNQILSVDRATEINFSSINPEIHTFLIEQFVKNARTVSIDGLLQKHMIQEAYAFTQGSATRDLQKLIEERDPYLLASTKVITIEINSVVPNIGGSPSTTQITWTEIGKDPKTSQVISKQTYTGQFTFKQDKKPASDESIMLYNPLGFYITNISWSKNYDTYNA